MKRFLSCVFLAVVWLSVVHCSSSAHGFVVVVNSDIASSDLDEVTIAVSREGQPEQIKTAPNPKFPLTLGITSDVGDRVTVRVAGARNGELIASNLAKATVQEEDQRMLVLDLCQECYRRVCTDEFVCVTATTCSAPGVDSTALPIWADKTPATACKASDRPKRETSQITPPPPSSSNDAGTDSGADSGPISSDADAGPDGSAPPPCPARTEAFAGMCVVTAPGACGELIDVSQGGVFVGTKEPGANPSKANCGTFQVLDTCGQNRWTMMTFETKTLPVGKRLHATLKASAELGFQYITGNDCKAEFQGCSKALEHTIDIDPNKRFAIAQRGNACEDYTFTFVVQ